MKVFIVFNGDAYEGSDTMGVFYTLEDAEACIVMGKQESSYGEWAIEAHEVQ